MAGVKAKLEGHLRPRRPGLQGRPVGWRGVFGCCDRQNKLVYSQELTINTPRPRSSEGRIRNRSSVSFIP